MPRISRGQTGGTCVHVINRGNARAEVFHGDEDYQDFVELIGLACQRVAMRVVGVCLMPNHFHMILRPRRDGELSAWMQWLMTSHVRRYHRKHGTSGHVWQGRFKSFAIQHRRPSRADSQAGLMAYGDPVLQVLRYVERNPLRASLVARAELWPWSSLRWWLEPGSSPDFWRSDVIHRPEDWVKAVNRAETEKELAALRRSVQRGTPFGSENWVSRVVRRWGLESTLRPPGRTPKKA